MTRAVDRFVCAECDQSIVSFPPQNPPPVVCAMCQYLDETITDPVEREELRARLAK